MTGGPNTSSLCLNDIRASIICTINSMGTSCRTTRLWIPHTLTEGCRIAGDLEQVEPDKPTQGRKVALILHGTMGHKDYLFQKKLAKALPIDSFRFDFRGSHETGGVWKMGALHEDLEDLEVVARYLAKEFGYVVDLVVGHSRGSVVALRWLCIAEEAKHVRGFVNVSGRYRMEKIHYLDEVYKPSFESQGYHEWKVNVARKLVVGRIYPQDMEEFASWDSSLVWDKFPSRTHVLTLHGLKDQTVPPYDAVIYARAFGGRSPGTHSLHFIEDGDHNFTAHRDEVVETITSWWSAVEGEALQTGIWNQGIRGKL